MMDLASKLHNFYVKRGEGDGFHTRTRTSFCPYFMRMRGYLSVVEGTGTAAGSTSRYVLCTSTSALRVVEILPPAKRCDLVLLSLRKVAVC